MKSDNSLLRSVMGSDYKTSFMLNSGYLDHFLLFCSERMEKLEVKSNYQKGRFAIEGNELLVYQSGIIIFEDNRKIKDIVIKFRDIHQLEIDELESYRSLEKEIEKSQRWEDTPKGVWLTSQQVQALQNKLNNDLDPLSGKKHEICRYVKGEHTLVINKNGVVYTIGGFENIIPILESVIKEDQLYGDFHRILIIDEKGRWERIGPVCIVVVDITTNDLIELQLQGLKDDNISRSTDHVENMNMVDRYCTWNKLFIEPQIINQSVLSKDNYRHWLDSQIQTFLNSIRLDFNDGTLVIIDEDLQDIINAKNPIIISKRLRIHPALGVSSTITNAHIQKWAEDWYKFLGFIPERHNIEKIRSHKQVKALAKKALL